MVKIDDRSFFDLLYSQWTRTTGAQDHYWMPEKLDPESDDAEDWQLFAVSEDQSKKHLASYLSGEDADFISAVHGCLPDLIRRLHMALDEADRLDLEKDDLVNRVAALELEADDLNAVIESKEERLSDLQYKLSDEQAHSTYLQCKVRDLERELELANDDLKAEADEFSSIIKDLTEQISDLESGRV